MTSRRRTRSVPPLRFAGGTNHKPASRRGNEKPSSHNRSHPFGPPRRARATMRPAAGTAAARKLQRAGRSPNRHPQEVTRTDPNPRLPERAAPAPPDTEFRTLTA